MREHEHADELIRTAGEIVANDRGILAADESTGCLLYTSDAADE